MGDAFPLPLCTRRVASLLPCTAGDEVDVRRDGCVEPGLLAGLLAGLLDGLLASLLPGWLAATLVVRLLGPLLRRFGGVLLAGLAAAAGLPLDARRLSLSDGGLRLGGSISTLKETAAGGGGGAAAAASFGLSRRGCGAGARVCAGGCAGAGAGAGVCDGAGVFFRAASSDFVSARPLCCHGRMFSRHQ